MNTLANQSSLSWAATISICALFSATHAQAQNDECTNAAPISGLGSFPFDTTGATTSAPAWPCGPGGADVWFEWTAARNGDHIFSTCVDASFDTTLEVFDGPCNMLASLACSDDDCGLRSRLTLVGATAGTRYLLRVGGSGGATGTGRLDVSAAPLLERNLLITPGTGFMNAAISERDTCVLALQCNGPQQDDRLIDQFVIPDLPNASGWMVTSVVVYATVCDEAPGGTPPAVPQSPIDDMRLRIYDRRPDDPAANLIFGDFVTNVLSETGWSGIYRVLGPNTHQQTNNPVMFARASVGIFLAKDAEYFLEWSLDSTPLATELRLAGESCLNQPATPPNPGVQGDGLWILGGKGLFSLNPALMGCQPATTGNGSDLPFTINGDPVQTIGVSYCGPAVPNSTGQSASITATGNPSVAANDVMLRAAGMPPAQFGYFLGSSQQGFIMMPGGSLGNLCLGGGPTLGRFNQPGQIGNTGATGEFSIPLDLNAIPTATGSMAMQPGLTWNFQTWYRDIGGNSNFTDGLAITFQ